MNDAAVVGRLIREYHLRSPRPPRVRRLHGSVRGTSVTYHVQGDGQAPYIVRAFRADGSVIAQFGDSAAETVVDWLVSRASTLRFLEESGYAAPRPVRVRSGELVGETGPWLTWATTVVDGPVLAPSQDQLRMLGGALGRLHSVLLPGPGQGPGPGRAAWHPEAAVPVTLTRLAKVAPLIPADWRPMHAAFVATAQAVRAAAGTLPRGLVHGDAWPGNGVQTGANEVTLTDWEAAGLGLPVLDLGYCLAECHLDSGLPPDQPEAWLVQPDEERIAAVTDGYSAVRDLSAAERDLLPEAVRFGAAFAGAIHFEAALTGDAGGPSMDARLARLRNRLAVSDTVAQLARPHLPAAGLARTTEAQDEGTQ
ncbi:MAG TPA: phosphotransferase [Streptosporangiaceae bacterium]|jgi:Ser/Thr protein kinase RdoA (MazF antagonist)